MIKLIIFFCAKGVNNKRNSTSLSLSKAWNKPSNLLFDNGVKDDLILSDKDKVNASFKEYCAEKGL